MNPRIVILLLLIPTAVFSLDYTADYVYGTGEVKTDHSWTPLEIGASVAAGASVRLQAGSVAELSSGDVRITIAIGDVG